MIATAKISKAERHQTIQLPEAFDSPSFGGFPVLVGR